MERWDGLGQSSIADSTTRPTPGSSSACTTTPSGPALGGTRMKVYSKPGEGLLDGMRLAEGMTNKWAAIDVAAGGGKAVLAVERTSGGRRAAGAAAAVRKADSVAGRWVPNRRGSGHLVGGHAGDRRGGRLRAWLPPRGRLQGRPEPLSPPGRSSPASAVPWRRSSRRRDATRVRTVLIQGVGSVGANLGLCS